MALNGPNHLLTAYFFYRWSHGFKRAETRLAKKVFLVTQLGSNRQLQVDESSTVRTESQNENFKHIFCAIPVNLAQ
jgi:hypothetical protein